MIRLQGAIRRLKKGYGFVAADDGHDYFFHWTSLEHDDFRSLQLKQRVEFELVPSSDKGPRAVNMRLVNGSATEGV